MKRVIVVGSPRSKGRSAHLAEMLFEASIDECPEDEIFLVPVSEIEVGPCIGCGACRRKTEVISRDEDGNEVSESKHRCVFDDDMQTLYDLLDDADELIIVSPIYFSGAPAPMKCVLDRMQPYFWENRREDGGARNPVKRPMTLHVIGEGNDPHGYAPLVSEVRSAMAIAGFKIERILDWVGKIDADGEIIADAEVVEDATVQLQAASTVARDDAKPAGQDRPKLNLSSGKQAQQGNRKGSQQGKQQTKKQSSQQARQQGKGKRRG
ncbi:MAG: flavodoxin family protein [Eggerthellaceae bacterium]|nr:flavodoxin family protein [Eggerthellaceae bacterium]